MWSDSKKHDGENVMNFDYSQYSLSRSEEKRLQAHEAAMAGDVEAQVRLAEYLKYAVEPIDWEEVRRWLLMAASQRNQDAYYHLGMMYCVGQGCDKDWHKALPFFLECEGENISNAQFHLGYMYYHGGYGLQQDRAKALEYFLLSLNGRAGEISHFENCYYYLGLLYQDGVVVTRDDYKAAFYFGIAAYPWSLEQVPTDPADYRPPVSPLIPDAEPYFSFNVKGEKVYALGGEEFVVASRLLANSDLVMLKDEIIKCVKAFEESELDFMNS
jgi:hypothetical protein